MYNTSNVSGAISALLGFGEVLSASDGSNFLTNISVNSDPSTCPSCPPDTKDYLSSTDFKTYDPKNTSVVIESTIISLSIEYDPSGVISGTISLNAVYDTSYWTPLYSVTESVTDSLGFSWSFSLSLSGSSYNTHTYTHQDTTITYQITIETGPYYTDYGYYYLEAELGTHISVPLLT